MSQINPSTKPLITKIRWQALQSSDREHLVLTETDKGIVAESVYLSGGGRDAFAVHYKIVCDCNWVVQEFCSKIIGSNSELTLRRTESGSWHDGTREVTELEGTIDLDLCISPFTNTLAIQRLKLKPGESADIVVAYVTYPEHQLIADPQRYVCKSPTEYVFESVDSDFKAQITIDEKGLVVYYPEMFARIG